jgi:hypothetical protein
MTITVGAPPAPFGEDSIDERYADSYPISVPLIVGPATQQLIQGDGRFCGWALIEPSGAAAAVVELYDGMDTRAQLFTVFTVPLSGSTPTSISHEGIGFREGLLLNVISGQVRGVVWVRARLPW